ncbi:MAG: SpoIIE family protein phosphatase [Phycisphaerales bacterium]|nr:SpoIIE family protein phosphatase [Phycisphaerales bacterium]
MTHIPQEILYRILEVSQQLGSTADTRSVQVGVVNCLRDVLKAERATVFEHDAAAGELVAVLAHGPDGGLDESFSGIRFPVGTGLAGSVAQTREMINIPDAYSDDRFNPEIDKKTGYRTRSLLTVPMCSSEGDLVGVAQVLNKKDGVFDLQDEAIAAALAAQCAVAMRRSRLIEHRVELEKVQRDLRLAREIQQSTFPSACPPIAGYDCAGYSEPAEDTGGDTWDAVATGTGAVFLVGDATGHGIGPAISVTQVRSMLRMALLLGADPKPLVDHLNRQLAADTPPSRFVTAWFGVLDTMTHTLSSIAAGQGPLIHLHADDQVDVLAADAPPLGIMADLPLGDPIPFKMEPGDLFFVASDGFAEAAGPDREMFGTDRIIDLLREHRDRSSVEILQVIRDRVVEYTAYQPADDDRTAVLIHRLPTS